VRPLPVATLQELERTAVQLAQLAGEYIHTLPLDALAVQFKTARPGAASNADPVSNVDREIEARLRRVVSERFPQHVVIGEESEQHEPEDAPFIWVIDPLDGTTNYLNGLPLFASSIGVLHRHAPVAGAIWCACTHERRPGVYHAYHDGPLSLDGAPLIRRPAAAWRGLASEPGDVPRYGSFFETRVLAAAALECAFAAAVSDLAGLGLLDDPEGRAALAAACVRAENVVAGAPTGGLDQSAALLTTPGHALLLDCQDFHTEQVPFDLDAHGLALVVVDTRAEHTLVDGQYAERRDSCERAAAELGGELGDPIDARRPMCHADLGALAPGVPRDRVAEAVAPRHADHDAARAGEQAGARERNREEQDDHPRSSRRRSTSSESCSRRICTSTPSINSTRTRTSRNAPTSTIPGNP